MSRLLCQLSYAALYVTRHYSKCFLVLSTRLSPSRRPSREPAPRRRSSLLAEPSLGELHCRTGGERDTHLHSRRTRLRMRRLQPREQRRLPQLPRIRTDGVSQGHRVRLPRHAREGLRRRHLPDRDRLQTSVEPRRRAAHRDDADAAAGDRRGLSPEGAPSRRACLRGRGHLGDGQLLRPPCPPAPRAELSRARPDYDPSGAR